MNLYKSTTAKIAAGIVGFAMVMTALVPTIASADATSDLIATLTAQLAALTAQLAALQGGSSGSSMGTGYTFNTNLTMGSTGSDVMNLQRVLNMSADTRVSSSGAGSPGSETSTFGGLT